MTPTQTASSKSMHTRWKNLPWGMMMLVMVLVIAADAMLGTAHAQAAPATLFTNLGNKATDFFYNLRTIVLLVCAVAFIITMAYGISGRFPVTRTLTVVAAIIGVAGASEVVTYFASPGTTTTGTISSALLTDTSAP